MTSRRAVTILSDPSSTPGSRPRGPHHFIVDVVDMVLGFRAWANALSWRSRPHRMRFHDPQLNACPAGSCDGRSPDWSMISSSSLPLDPPQFGSATAHHPDRIPQRERFDGSPIHAKSRPKFAKAYSPVYCPDSFLPIVMDRTIHLSNDHRAQRRRGLPEPFAWSDFFPQFFLHLRELVVTFSNSSSKRRGWQYSTFEVPLQRERRPT